MSKSLFVVMDPISSISVYKDTTLALLLAAQRRGWSLYYAEQQALFVDNGVPMGNLKKLIVRDDEQDWFTLETEQTLKLGDFDLALMRKDPPFDQQYIYTTYILELAEAQGCMVVNRPQSLRDCNEKFFATHFPECCPPLLISRSIKQLKAFHKQQSDVVFKPLDGMGGSRIFRSKFDDPNVNVTLEVLTDDGREYIMAQRYLPEIKDGDKRILVVNGKAVPYALARIPGQGETRGNLAAGGKGVAQPLSPRDEWIVEQVAPVLVKKGLLFVGLDVIGDYLTEINVTSPTCVREIDRAYDTDIGSMLFEAIEDLFE